jgi:hyperosmotically inducible periplasmic protein
MKQAAFVALVLLAAVGCSDTRRSNSTANTPPKDSATPTTVTSDTTTADRDNTAVNVRDRSDAAKTPIDQNENQKDINTTADIRKRVVDSKMSTDAKNAKIITQNGKVTLRGPVKSENEKKEILKIAIEVAGEGNVDDQLEVQP